MTGMFTSVVQTTLGASVLIVLVLVLMLAIGKRYSRKWRYWVWLFIAVRLILPFELPLDTVITLNIPEQTVSAVHTPSVGNNAVDNITTPADTTEPAPITPAEPVTPPTVGNTENTVQTPSGTFTPSVGDKAPDKPVREISVTEILSVIWLVGAVLCLVWRLASHVRFVKRTRMWNRPVDEPWANEMFSDIKKEMGVTKDIKLCRNRCVHSPLLTGFFKPVVLIPTRNLSENDLYMVLCHELLHFKRHDLWYKLILMLAGCVHWFNPLVWFMQKRADRDLEIACDEAVVKGESMEFRKDYCETILRIIRCDRGAKPALSTGFTTGKKTLKKRFACVLDSTARRRGVALLCIVLCAAMLCSAFIGCEAFAKKDLEKYYDEVLYFAERIPQTFESTAEIENYTASLYTLWSMVNAENYEPGSRDDEHIIAQTELNKAAKLLLGMEKLVPDKDIFLYNAENDTYTFYSAGEGPMYSGEITSAEEKGGMLCFTVTLTQKLYGSEEENAGIAPEVRVITYCFDENNDESYPLKSIKAEFDDTQEQTIFINSNTLTEHLVKSVYEDRYSVDIPLIRTKFSDQEINRFLLFSTYYMEKPEYRYSDIARPADSGVYPESAEGYPYFFIQKNINKAVNEVFSRKYNWQLESAIQKPVDGGYLVENAYGVTVQYQAENMRSTASNGEIKTVFDLMAYTSNSEGPYYKNVGRYEAVYAVYGEGLCPKYIRRYEEKTTAVIDVKNIGVLGYVENAGELVKSTDWNAYELETTSKTLRICIYDAEKNGYTVYYHTRRDGDNVLMLARTVESYIIGSGLTVNSARVEKGFVIVDMKQLNESAPVDDTKVRELLESIACTMGTNGYYLTGFTLRGAQFDFGGITLEADGYGRYEYEPLYNQPITTEEFSALRSLLKYPFPDGLPEYEGNEVAFAQDIEDKNRELASLIYYTAVCDESLGYTDFSSLSDTDKATAAIFMLPDTYECVSEPEKWSGVIEDFSLLYPLCYSVTDTEFIPKEWVEQAVKQLWGEDAEITHPDMAKPKWSYRREAGVYTPPYMGGGYNVCPYIRSVTKTNTGYTAEVSYIYEGMTGIWGKSLTGTEIVNFHYEWGNPFDSHEILEYTLSQPIYTVTAEYGKNGNLHIVSCVKKDEN